MKIIDNLRTPPSVNPQLAFLSILGFWIFYMVIVTLRAAVLEFPSQGEMAVRRLVVIAIGIALTWCLYLFMRLFERQPLSVRITTAFLGAIPFALIFASINYYVFVVYDPISLFDEQDRLDKIKELQHITPIKEILEVAISRYFFISCWAALYLAISYAGVVRAAERRAARYARAAQEAEIRSLRYQVNPHFLFNTLNSLSSLVMRQRPEEAEAMIMNLSSFYRQSLSGDPLDDVTLADEVELQKIYLDIEAVRFPNRLKTEIDVPDRLEDACVPGFILQPLVENAIKYGVSRASRPVTVTIAARREDETLHLWVADDGDVIPGDGDKGSGIGLANVRDRLAARFGERASLTIDRPEGGGFRVDIVIPYRRDD